MNLDYKISGNNIILRQADFDLDHTLDCGQAFRWEKTNDSSCSYKGFFLNRPLFISQEGYNFTFHDTSEEDFLTVWAPYFDLDTDYAAIKESFSADETLRLACTYASGIRLLRQDPWEALCSFIISQNNNIPRIKGIIARLCEHYDGFPDCSQLCAETEESLSFMRSGFRARYLLDAAHKVSEGVVDFTALKTLPLVEARKMLSVITGVGPKVCECVLLYGFNRRDAFPVDVWIKRVMSQFYPQGLPDCVKGNEGIAQQYLFHYMRTCQKV